VNSAQVWTVIAGFFGILVVIVGSVLAQVRAELSAIRAEIAVLRERVDGIRNELLARFEALHQDVQRHEAVLGREEPPAA
jgi:uncharacterized protein YoxC